MKNSIIYLVLLFAALPSTAQTVLGKWKTVDDKTGIEKSIVEIYKDNGKVYGRVTQILEKGKEDKTCENCSGPNKDKPIKGMVIINGLTRNGSDWDGGTILDPETGKVYKCYITLEGKNELKVRGYIGFSLLGRTQYWYRE